MILGKCQNMRGRNKGLLCWICIPFWNLWPFTSKRELYYLLSMSWLSSSPVLREWPSARSLQPFPLLAGHCVHEASCLQSWWQEKPASYSRGVWMNAVTSSLFLPGRSVCLRKAQLPGRVGSMWYLVSGLLFSARTLDNITVPRRNTCKWEPSPLVRHRSNSDKTWAWGGEDRLKLEYFEHIHSKAVKN